MPCEDEQKRAREAYEALQKLMDDSNPHNADLAQLQWREAEKAYEDCMKSPPSNVTGS